ncbi:MAG: hydrogenase expression/formation protein HypE, partial [Candidatus Zixiibacteriota bacterium]
PIRPHVQAACELLGLDPLHVANEGKLVASVAPEAVAPVLAAMKTHPLGADAAVIGEVTAEPPGQVSLQTRLGAWRIVDLPVGELLPRIC